MAYNGGFPMGYTQYYPMQQTMPPQGTQAANNGIIWVQGEAGAKSYLVAPNNTVQLWDSESQTIYLKSADASGMPTMKILDYTIRDTAQNTTPAIAQQADFVTRDELSRFEEKVMQMIKGGNDDGKSDF